jgi:hypothetical protein
VALARAAGYKAYVMAVTDRDQNLFFANYLQTGQLDDELAVVSVGGKDVFLDPGQRYCPYGHLAWKHTMAGGMRQMDSGSALAEAPSEPYTNSRMQRIAELKLDDHGVASGTVVLTFMGNPALRWRQLSLRTDATELQRQLKSTLEHTLPGGVEVTLESIQNLEDYEQPLKVNFHVQGAIGSPTGRRLLVQPDVFLANEKPAFPHEKRELAVFFDYPYYAQDAVRITLPATMAIESAPATATVPFDKFAEYKFTSDRTANSVTVRRDLAMGNIFYKPEEYPALREFYGKMETKDQEPVVLKAAASAGVGN